MDELREAFEQAYEESEAQEEKEQPQEVENNSQEQEISSQESEALVDDSQDANQEKDVDAKEQEAEVKEASDERAVTEEKTAPVGKSKAPSSWNPKARESWGNIGEEAQRQIIKREKEVNQVLQDSSQARNFAAQFNNLIAPHRESLIAAGASNPLEAVQNLLQAESQLRLGSAQQKAQAAAKMIKDYNIDIGALDGALSGQPAQQSAVNNDIEQLLDQRLAPVNQFLQQQQQEQFQQQVEVRNSAEASIEEFSHKAEFLGDVRNEMANLLDMASHNGQIMSLQQAYDMACAGNPEISEIIRGRAAREQIMGGNSEMQSKRMAAKSITGRQGGAGASKQSATLRGQIEDIWNDYGD